MAGIAKIVSFAADKLEAYEEDIITFTIEIRNDGDSEDELFTIIKESERGGQEFVRDTFILGASQNKLIQYNFTMSDRGLNLKLLAGHVRRGDKITTFRVNDTQTIVIGLSEIFAVIKEFVIDKEKAHVGEPVTFSFILANEGNAPGDLFGRIIDEDTGEKIGIISWYAIPVGEEVSFYATRFMPKDGKWAVRLESGHIEYTP